MALNLWLADRSRYEEGTAHCARGRYLAYHAGPTGYGWQKRAVSIPAVTGQLIHAPIAWVHEYLLKHDALPPDAYVYEGIQRAQDAYWDLVRARGLANVMDEQELFRRTHENTTLLEALVWVYARVALPALHATDRVVLVEEECLSVLGCTCGLGDLIGEAQTHSDRECQGIGWMTRGDAITANRQTGSLTYREIKTTSDASMNWEAQWQYRVQLVAGVLGAEQRLGERIDAVMIPALIKGKYQSEWNPDTKSATGPKFQNTPLVYGWYRPANPPLLREDWRPKKAYVDEFGKNRRLTQDYTRTGVWELSADLWQTGGCFSPTDYWCRWLEPTGILAESYRLIGPIYRQDWQLEQFLTQLVAEERRWQARLWAVYAAEGDWFDPQVQTVLDREVPQTKGGSCHSYFGDTCPMIPLCYRHAGWEDPAMLGFIPRRPHHSPELTQAIARGLLAPDVDAGETYEE